MLFIKSHNLLNQCWLILNRDINDYVWGYIKRGIYIYIYIYMNNNTHTINLRDYIMYELR